MNSIYYVFIHIIDIHYLVKEKIHFFMKIAGLSNKFSFFSLFHGIQNGGRTDFLSARSLLNPRALNLMQGRQECIGRLFSLHSERIMQNTHVLR